MGDTQSEHTEIGVTYKGSSDLNSAGELARMQLYSNIHRDPVQFSGTVHDPIQLREALLVLSKVVGSDYSYVPKDRTAYNAYRRMRNATSNLGNWESQQAYFNWLAENDPLAFLILDPLVSVHPDELGFEVFSKDEGSYAKLSLDHSLFTQKGEVEYGTTNIDFSESLLKGVLQFRNYRETELVIQNESVSVETDGEQVLEKKIKLPDSWLRGFLQVQSAMMMPKDSFSIAPMDLYNVLRTLRMNADQKGKRRGLRVELIPGELPNLVLEPWETVITSTEGTPYKGKQAKVIRVWGRRRLMLMQKFLPFCDSVEVHLTGSGLPSFWVLKGKGISLTLGLTGFTSSNWSQAASFDLLLPRTSETDENLSKVLKHLKKCWVDDLKGIATATKLKNAELLAILQLGCSHGQLILDVATQQYRLRPVTNVELDLEKLKYRNLKEKEAHDLVATKGAVTISTENRIHGVGVEITGKVKVEAEKREYSVQMLINDDGFVVKADCTCKDFREQGLKQGPCSHLIALRVAYAERVARRQSDNKSRNSITVETRTYSRRKPSGEDVVQLTLDKNRLRMKWGKAGEEMRSQQFQFGSVAAARTDYLTRINKLALKGYLDASAN